MRTISLLLLICLWSKSNWQSLPLVFGIVKLLSNVLYLFLAVQIFSIKQVEWGIQWYSSISRCSPSGAAWCYSNLYLVHFTTISFSISYGSSSTLICVFRSCTNYWLLVVLGFRLVLKISHLRKSWSIWQSCDILRFEKCFMQQKQKKKPFLSKVFW